MADQIAALEGIQILDFSHVFQGPVATQMLADYGADVIKIERPDWGDWSRRWGPYVDKVSLPYAHLNRNKRSLAVNVKAAAGKEIIIRLVEQADVLVHNFRIGVMEKLGLGYEELIEVNPRLVYAQSGGWGDEGPYVARGRGGHDLMARAEAGWFLQFDDGRAPLPGGMSADYPAGLVLAQAILVALLARERSGRGQLVTTDLFSVAMHANVWEGATALNRTRIDDMSGVGATEQIIDKAFLTSDGALELSPVFSPNVLRDISTATGLGDLSEDRRFSDDEARLAHREELNAILAARFQEKTTGEWLALLEPQGILCARVRTYEEAIDDPQLAANDMVVEMDHARAGTLRLLGTPMRLHDTPPTYRLPPADLGEHNQEVLLELGYSPAEIDELVGQGVLG